MQTPLDMRPWQLQTNGSQPERDKYLKIEARKKSHEDAAKMFRKVHLCDKLQTIIISEKAMFSSAKIQKILQVASNRGELEIVVASMEDYRQWIRMMEKQKLRSCAVKLSCTILDNEKDNEQTALQGLPNFNHYLQVMNYKHCNYEAQNEKDIVENADDVARRLGSHFVGSIVCFEQVKVLVSSLDIFFHLEEIDDCAYTNQWNSKSVFARLHLKSEKGNQFFELSLIVGGCVELLAVGGLVLINGGSVEPFLGSSVKPLNRAKVLDGDVSTSKIFVRENVEVLRSERLLRQYYKRDAVKQWQFHMKMAHDVGFYPIKPLQVDDHPSIDSLPLTIQSTLLRCYAKKQADTNCLAAMFSKIVNSSMLVKECKVSNFSGSSFLDLYNAMTTEGKWKMVVGMAKNLEVGSVDFSDDKKNITTNKKVVLQLVGSGFLQNLSRAND
ncbi:hypothetical protein MBANPS3_009407 [Mucor bainieri]